MIIICIIPHCTSLCLRMSCSIVISPPGSPTASYHLFSIYDYLMSRLMFLGVRVTASPSVLGNEVESVMPQLVLLSHPLLEVFTTSLAKHYNCSIWPDTPPLWQTHFSHRLFSCPSLRLPSWPLPPSLLPQPLPCPPSLLFLSTWKVKPRPVFTAIHFYLSKVYSTFSQCTPHNPLA